MGMRKKQFRLYNKSRLMGEFDTFSDVEKYIHQTGYKICQVVNRISVTLIFTDDIHTRFWVEYN